MRESSRRNFLRRSLGLTSSALLPAALWPESVLSALGGKRKKLPVAGLTTVYRRNSHSHVILGKIVEGYNQLGGPGPDLELVSMFVDQFHSQDTGRALTKKHGILLARSIPEAITLGSDEVKVAAVLSIAEHGDYAARPVTRQQMFPRKRFFDETLATFRRCGKVVPFFNDKHLSYSTEETMDMYRMAKEYKIPFMAGSSLPLAWRDPPLELPMGCEIEGAVALGFGGMEPYGYHTLEMLQCMIERRKGGETGVKSVRAVKGAGVLQAEKDGYWSLDLVAAARKQKPDPGLREQFLSPQFKDRGAFLIDYRDGLKAAVLMTHTGKWQVAAKLKGEASPRGTEFTLQEGAPYRHFEYLVRGFEPMVHTGKPAYPVERTVLTSVVLDAALNSLANGSVSIETPELDFAYQPVDWPFAKGLPPKPRKW